MEEKRDLRVVRTQKLLKKAFYELIVEKPVEKITVRELTELAEVSRCTFYLHYSSVFDIAKSIEDDMLLEYQQGFRKTIESNTDYSKLIEELIVFSFRHKYDNLPYSKILYLNHGSSELVEKYKNIATQELKRAFPVDWNDGLETALRFYVSGIINLIHDWLLQDEITETPEEMSELAIKIISNGKTYLSILNN